MIGKLLEKTIKVATLPIDAANAGMDILCGGDGSKESRCDGAGTPGELLEDLRDAIADAARKIDDDKD